MSKTYIVIQQHLWCNEKGHGIEYTTDSIESGDRDNAIKRGLKMQGSDDFNIGVIDGGRLVSFDWMDKPVGESAETLAEIAEAIGYEGGCTMSNIDKHSELRKELSNPAIGSNAHLRKLALALLDELEAKDKAWSAQDNHINQQADRIESLEKKNGELGRALGAEGKRIAELEAKKVKIKMPESFYPDGDIECPLVINEYQIIEAILAAGCMPTAVCPRCKSELDLSHKHDGAHYCHAAGPGKGD